VAKVRITQWNADALLELVPQVLEAYGEKVAPMLQEQIKAKEYEYPVPTLRKVGVYSGRFVPKGKRDIVDTGALLKSQQAPQVEDNTLRIRWTADYAGEVLRGGYLVGTVRVNYMAEARDWITPVLEAAPPEQFFAEEWRRLANAQ
jgi:hypothetical protein